MDIDKKAIGMRISNIRKNRGLTLEEFGALVEGAGKSIVSKWERGLTVPNNSRLKEIAKIGNTSIDELMYGGIGNFILSNLKYLLPPEYSFITKAISMPMVQALAYKVKESNVTVLEVEKIKSIVQEQLPLFIDDIEKTVNRHINVISNHKNYRDQIVEYFNSEKSAFDKIGLDKIDYIFENANHLTFEEKVNLFSGIEDIYTILDSIINNRTYYFDTHALFMGESFFLNNLNDINFKSNDLPSHNLHYKSTNKLFPQKYEHHEILIEIQSVNKCDFLKPGENLLLFHFPKFEHNFLKKYFIGTKLAIIHDECLFLGQLDSDLNFTTMVEGELFTLNLDNKSVHNTIFPLAAIFY